VWRFTRLAHLKAQNSRSAPSLIRL